MFKGFAFVGSIPLVTVDMKNVPEDVFDEVRDLMATSCGFMALTLNQDGVENIPQWLDKESAKAFSYSCSEGSKVILQFKQMADLMSDEELQAIHLHESGHLKLGHVQDDTTTIKDSMRHEREADAYAYAHGVSKSTMKCVLQKTLNAVIEMVPEENREDARQYVWSQEALIDRLQSFEE